MSKEIELKFAVRGPADFDALVRRLDLPAREFHTTVMQVSHFFDTRDFALHAKELVLRLREEMGLYSLAFKGGEVRRTEDGVATERLELEVRLAPNVAVDILRGTVSPRSALQQRIGEQNPDALTLLDEALARRELHYVGQIENRRTRLKPVEVDVAGKRIPLVFELDRTRFSTERTDYEVEVELGTTTDPAAAHAAVAGLLADAGIEWRSAPSKAKRFFDLLRSKR